MHTTSQLRDSLASPGALSVPSCSDPLTALAAQDAGFKAVALGGYALGARAGITEPRLSLLDVVEAARGIASVVDIPLIVDVGAGFGEQIHVMRTVRELEQVGVAAIHIEDQVYPKRAHYHRDYLEETTSEEEMVAKIQAAAEARRNRDFVLIARTDTAKTHGFEEAIRRAESYSEAGADLIMLFPNTIAEAEAAPKRVRAPVVYVNSSGNRVERPVLTAAQADEMGYKMLYHATSLVCVAYAAMANELESIRDSGIGTMGESDARRWRLGLERVIGLEEYYDVETRLGHRPTN